jgi:FtsH-binding integral membrane protein
VDFEAVWLGILVAAAIGYVVFRRWAARRRGDDDSVEVRRATKEVLLVVGAGLAGVAVFAVLATLAMAVIFSAVFHNESVGAMIYVLIVAPLVVLFGFPLAAIVILFVRRRRQDLR